jgi:hypothetical protein
LIVLAAGTGTSWRNATEPRHLLTVPQEFIRTMGHLYPRRELLWWVVVEDADGRVLATSEARRLVWR